MHGCAKCCKVSGWLFLILGILYLLADLNVIAWWSINWWTAVFVLWGIGGIAKSGCPDCQAMMPKKR